MKWNKGSEPPKEDGIYVTRLIRPRLVSALEFVSAAGGWNTSYKPDMFEWLDESPSPSGANHLVEALEQIRDGAIPINEQQYVSWIATARQIAHSALAQYKSQPGSLQGEQLIWKEGKTLVFDWTVLFSESYNFEGLELMAQETKTEIGRVVIWPDRLSRNKKWSFYFEYDGWLKQDFDSEEDVKSAVQYSVNRILAFRNERSEWASKYHITRK